MAIFHTAERIPEKTEKIPEKGSGLEELSEQGEEVVRSIAEENIRKTHHHASGEPPKFTLVRPEESSLEQATGSHQGKHAGMQERAEAYNASGKGVSFTIQCDCGQQFHSGATSQNSTDVYNTNPGQKNEPGGDYARASRENESMVGYQPGPKSWHQSSYKR